MNLLSSDMWFCYPAICGSVIQRYMILLSSDMWLCYPAIYESVIQRYVILLSSDMWFCYPVICDSVIQWYVTLTCSIKSLCHGVFNNHLTTVARTQKLYCFLKCFTVHREPKNETSQLINTFQQTYQPIFQNSSTATISRICNKHLKCYTTLWNISDQKLHWPKTLKWQTKYVHAQERMWLWQTSWYYTVSP